MYIFIYVLYMGIAVGVITFTIAVTSIFAPVRELVAKIHPKVEELIFCPFCLSFYVGVFIVAMSGIIIPFGPDKISMNYTALDMIYSLLVTVFVVMGFSGLVHYVLLRAYEPVMKNMAMRKIEKLREKKPELKSMD